MIDDKEYRPVRDNYKSWVIQERHVIKKGDNTGKWTDWLDYKYPGKLENAVKGMLMLGVPEGVGYNLDELDTVLAQAVEQVKVWLQE